MAVRATRYPEASEFPRPFTLPTEHAHYTSVSSDAMNLELERIIHARSTFPDKRDTLAMAQGHLC